MDRLLATIPCKTFVLPLYNHNKRHNQSAETIILSAGLYGYKTRAQSGKVGLRQRGCQNLLSALHLLHAAESFLRS